MTDLQVFLEFPGKWELEDSPAQEGLMASLAHLEFQEQKARLEPKEMRDL